MEFHLDSLRLKLLQYLLIGCVGTTLAQPPGPGAGNTLPPPPDSGRSMQPRNPGEGMRSFRSSAGVRNLPLYREGGGTSSPLAVFRRLLQDEVKNVPALVPRLNELLEVQQQRNALQKQRAQVADDRSLSSEESLRKFHDLLKREDELNTQQKTVFESMLRDAPVIQKQIAERRKQIQQRIQELGPQQPSENNEPPTLEQEEARSLGRASRFYEFLDSRVTSLQAHPDRLEMLNRFFKGMPNIEEPDAQTIEKARVRLDQIQQEQDELADRLDKLEDEVRELRQFLRGPGGGQRARNREREVPVPAEAEGSTTASAPSMHP